MCSLLFWRARSSNDKATARSAGVAAGRMPRSPLMRVGGYGRGGYFGALEPCAQIARQEKECELSSSI